MPACRPVVVMGAAGAGKTTVGVALAAALGRRYVEGDDLHSPVAVAKMRRGEPLDDADRLPWLDRLAQEIASDPELVMACSALRRPYRERLPDAFFVHLTAPEAVLRGRVASRPGHFMPEGLVASQLRALEPLAPDEAGLTLDAQRPVAELVAEVVAVLEGYDGELAGQSTDRDDDDDP